jgi:hypothetical protein
VAATVGTLIARTLVAFDGLTATGDAIADEAQYLADLGVVWKGRLIAVGNARKGELASAAVETAVDAVCAEAARIDDPHRAIDWLSTLPQVVLVALGEPT